ncbi:restriction endonuclease subunit S [Desulfovibrio piger]|uniref:Type I restriction modification DNA specificity domain protein n=1 Tax=Desulfovibrio piger ATCC 29098 TaxID=411464 RepID=B6WSZ4_9BACT|nr:restriction endonuclease subunit S [Desulfovibrio piger]EEB33906.1 type I restriction modification DNA specificity domain protein [Desulfovibrio piger ATCC 29098]
MNTRKYIHIREISKKILSGGTPSTKNKGYYYNGDIPWLNTKEINFKRIYKTENYINQDGLRNSSAKWIPRDSVIVAMYGATAGKVAINKIPLTTNQACCNLIINEKVADFNFIYYYLVNEYEKIIKLASGAAQQNLNVSIISNYIIFLPPLYEQKAIVGVLSSLDDKIDLLQRQNATLEAMAETLFRQWFIEEAQEDWEEYPLSSFIEIIGGGTPKTSEESYWHGDILWMSGGDIASSHKSFIFDTDKKISSEGLENSSANLLPKFSTVITARGTVGKICLLGEQAAFSQTNYGILPRIAGTPFFTFLLMSDLLCYLKQSAYGSVFDTITRSTFEEIKFNCPTDNYIVNFENMISPFFQKMFSNCRQIRTLEKLRDTLLPKLMSGEVRVRVDG